MSATAQRTTAASHPEAMAPTAEAAVHITEQEWRRAAYVRERTLMYLSAYGGYVFLVLAGGFGIVAGLAPPHNASWTPQELADFYNDNHLRIQVGVVGCMVASSMYIPLYSMVSQIIDDHMRMPLLAKMQLFAALMGGMFVMLMFLAYGLSMYRPERNPEITQALNDWGWMFAWWTVFCTMMQVLAWGLAVLLCKPEHQVFDRWFGWLLIFAVLVEVVAWFIPLFQRGPFAYDGELTFWFMVPLYGVFVFLSAREPIRALRRIDERMGLARWSFRPAENVDTAAR